MKPTHDVLNCHKCFYLRLAAFGLWSLSLIILSLLPGADAVSLFQHQDKALHVLAYLLNAWLACRVLQLFRVAIGKIVFIAVIYSLLLGGMLELFQQLMTTTRMAEWLDFAANAFGAFLGCALFCLQVKISSRNHD